MRRLSQIKNRSIQTSFRDRDTSVCYLTPGTTINMFFIGISLVSLSRLQLEQNESTLVHFQPFVPQLCPHFSIRRGTSSKQNKHNTNVKLLMHHTVHWKCYKHMTVLYNDCLHCLQCSFFLQLLFLQEKNNQQRILNT